VPLCHEVQALWWKAGDEDHWWQSGMIRIQGSHAVWNCRELSGIFKCHFQTSCNVGNLNKVVEMSWNVWNFDTMTHLHHCFRLQTMFSSQLRIAVMFGLCGFSTVFLVICH
jgi:hypothetical protein